MRRALLGILAMVAILGCGGEDGGSRSGRLVVSAAASLKPAFERYGETFGAQRPVFSFAGSDELAAQIRQGVKPDVFAAANLELPARLYSDGLVERPLPFVANRLVVAIPADRNRIDSLDDLAGQGVRIAAGSPSVPIGAYTRKLLARIDRPTARRILANIRSSEPDVAGVVGKLTQSAVDAGFVYATDVRAAKGALKAIELPARLRPRVVYGAATVVDASHPQAARRFVAGLLRGSGRRALLGAGFEPLR